MLQSLFTATGLVVWATVLAIVALFLPFGALFIVGLITKPLDTDINNRVSVMALWYHERVARPVINRVGRALRLN